MAICGNCQVPMKCLGNEKIQLGAQNIFFGQLNHLLSGALEVEIQGCPQCGKIEFYNHELTKG